MCLDNGFNIGAVAAAHAALHGYAQPVAKAQHKGIALPASVNGAGQFAQLIRGEYVYAAQLKYKIGLVAVYKPGQDFFQ